MIELIRPGASVARDLVCQATVFLLVGGLAAGWAGRRPARAHRLLLLAMIAALITPMLCQGVRLLGWGVLDNGNGIGAVPFRAQVSAAPDHDSARVPPYLLPVRPEPAPRTAAVPREASPPAAPRWTRRAWPAAVLGGWAVLSALAAARLGVSLWAGRQVAAAAVRPLVHAEIEAAAEEARQRLGLAVRPQMGLSDSVRCPMVWCWGRRPLLLVPEEVLRRVTRVDWVAVFVHELAHWKRHDHLSLLVAELLGCVLAFHPLAWWAKARLVALSELACDDWVLASGRPAADYADSLLALTPQAQPQPCPAPLLAMVSSRGGLLGRVRYILDDHRPEPAAGRAWTGLAVVTVALLAAATALAQARPAQEEVPPAQRLPDAHDDAARGPISRRALSGTVLGLEGRPAAGARVRWFVMRDGRDIMSMPIEEVVQHPRFREKTLAEGRTDSSGRFAFQAEYDVHTYPASAWVVAWDPGAGLTGKMIRGTEGPLTLRLAQEVAIRGRILTPAGMPAAGVQVDLFDLHDERDEAMAGWGQRREEESRYPAYWPRRQSTDGAGRFTMAGVPAGVFARLELRHPDYAIDELIVTTGPKTAPRKRGAEIGPVAAEFEHTLRPARPVEGTVTAADTGKPLANTLIRMIPFSQNSGRFFDTRTDSRGHYRVSGTAGERFEVTVYPPTRSSYLGARKLMVEWPAGAQSLVIDFRLIRGKIIRGRVVDADTEHPMADCGVVYKMLRERPSLWKLPVLDSPVRTSTTGAFQMAVPPGHGYLAIEVPDLDYICIPRPQATRGTVRANGFAELAIAADGDPAPVEVRVRKGGTLKARMVDRDGGTIADVVALVEGIDTAVSSTFGRGQRFEDGVFRLRGADPNQTYRVLFHQFRRRMAVVADLKYDPQAKEPIAVQLEPTASIRGRLVDPAGHAVVATRVVPYLVFGPKGELPCNERFLAGNALGYSARLGGDDPIDSRSHSQPNDRGEFLLENLVPGVWFSLNLDPRGLEVPLFVPPLQPGEARDVGEVVLKNAGR